MTNNPHHYQQHRGSNNWSLGSPELPHPASVPICQIRASPQSEPFTLYALDNELSWCEKSIISLNMGNELDLSDTSTTSGSSKSINSALEPPGDATVMTSKGPKTVDEMDSELAAVQKLVHRQCARKRLQLLNNSESSLNAISLGDIRSLNAIGGRSTPSPAPSQTQLANIPPQYATLSNHRPTRRNLVPALLDSRTRSPSGTRSRKHTVTAASPPAVSVSSAALSNFMQDAESEFDT